VAAGALEHVHEKHGTQRSTVVEEPEPGDLATSIPRSAPRKHAAGTDRSEENISVVFGSIS